MFENVNIDWHISQDDGSTDFSDDETLDDPSSTTTSSRLNGTRTPGANVIKTFFSSSLTTGQLRVSDCKVQPAAKKYF
jgi:hypothetical protein